MTQTPKSVPDAELKAETVEVDAEIVDTDPIKPAPVVSDGVERKWWQFWKPKIKKPKRALLLRLFGIGIWGAIKLTILCVIVGFVVLTMQFDPTSPDVDLGNALGVFASNTIAAMKWTVTNFWKPATAGAIIILPIWVLWRLISLPFRR